MSITRNLQKINSIMLYSFLFTILVLSSCSSDDATSVDELGISGTIWVYENTEGAEQEKCTLTFTPKNVTISTIKGTSLDDSQGAIVSTLSSSSLYRSFKEQGVEYVSFNSNKYIINGSSMKSIEDNKEFIKQ